MRSSVLRQATRSLAQKNLSKSSLNLLAASQTATAAQGARNPRRDSAAVPVRTPRTRTSSNRTHKRASSSSIPTNIENDAGHDHESAIVSSEAPPPEEPSEDGAEAGAEDGADKPEGEKLKRTRRTKAEMETASAPPLPDSLNIIWTPENMDALSPSALPPPELMDKVLTDLHVTLHPHTQHRAAYASSSGGPSEPTLALYCPFEGGEYVVDETVRELARRTESEVVVLDAAQLAAGESGCFGKAASVFELPENPLHFRAPTPRPMFPPASNAPPREEEDNRDDYDTPFMPHMTVHLLSPTSRVGRPSVSRSSSNSPGYRIKAFFDELIRTPGHRDTEGAPKGKKRSRLIYIRDYPTLAASASTWYPSLLAAVRQRRQGPLQRPFSPVTESITIIFGITPSIAAPSSPAPFNPNALLGLMNSKPGSPVISLPPRSGRFDADYGEDEFADKARERRLRERLRKWERNESSLLEEMPGLPDPFDRNPPGKEGPGLVLLGGGISGAQGGPPPSLLNALQGRAEGGNADSDDASKFFRSSVLVPSVRNPGLERSCRISRRREINDLTMRMGVASVGGILEGNLSELVLSVQAEQPSEVDAEVSGIESKPEHSDTLALWEDWGRHIQLWKNVKSIADRTVGSIMAGNLRDPDAKPSLDPTPVPWSSVVSAWSQKSAIRDLKKAWVREAGGKILRERDPQHEDEDHEEPYVPTHDEIIQRVREDPDLSQHEQRLLGCIVDSASMNTSFEDVHLPVTTIDSVRSIVSLPLLHPEAFQHGILKQHSMTGCLLFGPPGTGKTLVVRALAKDAGCRMLAVQPSDVMDMYVGEGEKLVRSVFSLARRLSPCVVFLDEIDALFGSRSSARDSGSSLAHNGVITEFMQEMDGLKTRSDSNVVVIGATNRPFDLDDAILRRLPRRMLVDLPGVKEREEILKILLRDELLSPDVDLNWLAKRTELFSGSDLKHLCVSAALDAVKEGINLPWAVTKSSEAEEHPASVVNSQDTTAGAQKESSEAPTAHSATDAHVAETASSLEPEADATSTQELDSESLEPRVLYLRHFTKALKEISASSSESLGTLAALRKWNEEFGEGQKSGKRRRTIWGKGSFGFSEKKEGEEAPRDGHVSGP